MKTTLRVSVLLNLFLLGGLLFALMSRRKEETLPAPVAAMPSAPTMTNSTSTAPETPAEAFRWHQLDSGNDYRLFIANLRAIGCPENTIEDIVRGNVSRAFDWERSKLGINASTDGPWSESSEMALIDGLLGKPPTSGMLAYSGAINSPGQAGMSAAAPSAVATGSAGNFSSPGGNEQADTTGSSESGPATGYPMLAQNEYRPIAGMSASQPAVGQSWQQSGTGGMNQNPDDSAPQNDNSFGLNRDGSQSPMPSTTGNSPAGSPTDSAVPFDPLGPNDPYAKSGQDIMTDEQNDYDGWFESQVAAQGGGPLMINPSEATQ